MPAPAPTRLHAFAASLRRNAWGFAGAALIIYGVLLVIGQIVFWLRFGAWLEVPASTLWWHWMRALDNPFPLCIVPDIADPALTPDVLRAPRPGDWIEARRIVLWFLDLPLALYSIMGGTSFILLQLHSSKGAIGRARSSVPQ
jgi:hypothetical protein